ncbi:MAG TPA: questin oxidase family protein [Jatrophihabitans sp.]|nr:questin oxidase family protein [Jatrophihabitans sp.]
MTDSALIDDLLADQTYYIEFNGHLTNHVKHAVVALYGIGAGPEEVRRYYENYAKLTAYGFGLEAPRPSSVRITERNWRQYLGKRIGFAGYCEFFDAEEQRLGMTGLLREYVPQLLDGWTGSFTHAMIHLGWGLDADSRWMAIEGLAYLAFSYVACHAERAEPVPSTGQTAAEALLALTRTWDAGRDRLAHEVLEVVSADAGDLHAELARSGLQYRIARMLGEGHPLIYGSTGWLTGKDVATCFAELYYAASLIYLSQPGDFVLLHLITSLYAMERLAQDLPAEQQHEVIRAFWVGMLGIVFAERLFPKADKLATLHELLVGAVDDESFEADWAQLSGRARLEEEEHNPKLVYVLSRLWHRGGRETIHRAAAGQFTRTPALPPSFEEPPNE